MKKIPTLFQREFDHHRVVGISPVAPPELQWVLDGEGVATEKVDGACCAIIDGAFYKRYDAKKDKRGKMKLPPEGAIPCDDPDPVTGHWPHWVKVEESDPGDRWFVNAYHREEEKAGTLADGTYEAIGPHFQSNPYKLEQDILVRHGAIEIDLPDRSFEGIRDYLERHAIEGIVFWKDGEPRCKIKRKDFGFKWPCIEVGYSIPPQIREQIPDYFYTAMAGELFSVFGWARAKDAFYPDEDPGYADLASSTYGWVHAFKATCRKLDMGFLMDYYDTLPWYESDVFDGIIEHEIYRRFMNREHDGSNEYYQYLVKTDEETRAEEKLHGHME